MLDHVRETQRQDQPRTELDRAFNRPSGTSATDSEKLALGALVAVVGTGFTAMAAIYGATRQSATAYQVQLLSSDTSRILAQYNATITTRLAEMKNSADEALVKLKAIPMKRSQDLRSVLMQDN